MKTFTARALRLARDYRLPRVGLVLNTKEAAPLVGKAVEGAVLGTYAFDKYQQEKDDFFAKEASLTILAHPDHQADAEARRPATRGSPRTSTARATSSTSRAAW